MLGALRRAARRVLPGVLALATAAATVSAAGAQDDAPRRLDSGRFTVVFYPADDALAHALAASAARADSFPWLPRPRQRVLIALAPDAARFRAWAGPEAPEWGAALAFPESRRVVMQGHTAGSDAGDPIEVLRHELAHLALHEMLGNLPPRWFDEGYASVAAREWRRDDALATNVALVLRGTPSLDRVEQGFSGGTVGAQAAYALSYRAVSDLAALDPARGLTLFFGYWRTTGSLDLAVRRAFGLTLAGFERDFQARTRRTYGALALVVDLSLVVFVLTLLILPFFIARRRRDRKRLRVLLAADLEAERAEAEGVITVMLGGANTEGDPPPGHAGGGAPS